MVKARHQGDLATSARAATRTLARRAGPAAKRQGTEVSHHQYGRKETCSNFQSTTACAPNHIVDVPIDGQTTEYEEHSSE